MTMPDQPFAPNECATFLSEDGKRVKILFRRDDGGERDAED